MVGAARGAGVKGADGVKIACVFIGASLQARHLVPMVSRPASAAATPLEALLVGMARPLLRHPPVGCSSSDMMRAPLRVVCSLKH